MKKIEYKFVPLAITLLALGVFDLHGHKVSAEEKQSSDPPIAGASSGQLNAAEEDRRIASAKMDELMAAAEKLPSEGRSDPMTGPLILSSSHRGSNDLKGKANNLLSGIKASFDRMAPGNPGFAAKWYRNQVEGKTIYDLAGPEARPEFVAAVDASHAEIIRLHKTMISTELAWYQFSDGVRGLRDEARKRFPKDRLAQMNWFLDQVRGKKSEDLTMVLGLARGLSAEQVKADEDNRRTALEKMRELMASAAKLSQGDQERAKLNLSRIQSNYTKRSQADPVASALWYRKQVEGKTAGDFTGPEQGPEYVVAQAAASEAEKAAVDAVNKEMSRIYVEATKDADPARSQAIAQYQTGGNGLYAEARKRFPNDRLAELNWFLDQIRGKHLTDLLAMLEAARIAAERAAAAEKEELAKAISAIKASEGKLKNSQWHVVYTTGVLERARDVSSYSPLPLTRTEADVLYDYETDHYRVAVSGVREWPKSAGPQATPLLEWKHVYSYDGTTLRVLRIDGPSNFNSPQGFIGPDAASYERNYPHQLTHAVRAQAGAMYFLSGSPYNVQAAVPVPRLSEQLEMKSKQGQIKVKARDNGVWVIDLGFPLRLAYDPRKSSVVGVQFLAMVKPPEPTSANPANPVDRTKPPTELTGVVKIELEQVGEFWPPKTVTHANFLDAAAFQNVPSNGGMPRRVLPLAAERFEFSDVKINQPISSAAFNVEFSPGTHVFDRIANTAYMVAGTAAQPVPTGTVSLSGPQSPIPPSPPPATRGGAMSWITLVLSSLAAVSVVGVAVVMWRRARA